jgi:hypothetical protein
VDACRFGELPRRAIASLGQGGVETEPVPEVHRQQIERAERRLEEPADEGVTAPPRRRS